MAHLDAQSGFKTFQIDTSDVFMFFSIIGYAITGQSLESLSLKAKDFVLICDCIFYPLKIKMRSNVK